MKFRPISNTSRNLNRTARGFTLAEVLAALAFMAIVIPVALQALSTAARAGEVADRKAVAARIGEKVLNEQLVTGQWKTPSQKGNVTDGAISYDWQIKSGTWGRDNMQLVTVTVTYSIQGDVYEVNLNTLADSAASTQ
jgi:prepilin-type N-terminal cleavage/methylation domain-containing protein